MGKEEDEGKWGHERDKDFAKKLGRFDNVKHEARC